VQVYFPDRRKWRAWLAKNHDRHREAWLVFYKPHAGKPSLSYDAAVEEALCYGWIDSIIRRVDDERYVRKFTPRTNSGRWSESNLKRVRKLVEAGLMTDIGLAKMDAGVQPTLSPTKQFTNAPAFFKRALTANPKARRNFMRMADSYRRMFVGWVCTAKKAETRQRRMREAIQKLERNEKLGLK
jgi:uncharacterized protein YdeI (YjbR/CyaY-like superfamily)